MSLGYRSSGLILTSQSFNFVFTIQFSIMLHLNYIYAEVWTQALLFFNVMFQYNKYILTLKRSLYY